MSLFKELIIRIIIIISVTNIIEFYVITKRHLEITPLLVFLIIIVTIVPIVINIWYCLHRNGLL